MKDKFLMLNVAQIFEVPEESVEANPDVYEVYLGLLLEDSKIQKKLRKYIRKSNWKENHRWYGNGSCWDDWDGETLV